MFATGSRYERVPIAIHVDRNGVRHPYVLLRAFPPAAPVRGLHEVADFERLDLLASRFFGDPEQFWRLCDASGELRPKDLELVGRRVPIPLVVR